MSFKINYYLCLIYLSFVFISCQTGFDKTNVVIEKSSFVKPQIALSKPTYRHTSFRLLSQILFDSAFIDPTFMHYEGQSRWLKIQVDTTSQPLYLDFINYYEVEGFDAHYKAINRISSEFYLESTQRERHIAFKLPLSKTPQTLYFKVFSLKTEASNPLKIAFTPMPILDAQISQSFYESRTFYACFMVLVGVALFQILYVTSLAWSRRRPEYWYYLLFTVFGVLYILAVRRFELGLGESKWLISSSIVSHIAIITFFYARFVRNYLETPKLNKYLDRQLQALEIILLVGVVINIGIFLTKNDIGYASQFHEGFDKLVKVINIYFLFFFYAQRSKLIIYLLMGLATMVVPGLFIVIYELGIEYNLWSVFLSIKNFDFLPTIGSILDAACLNLGLNYKHRLEVIAQQNALSHERNRIATEMHDDLGSGLSTIRLLGERAQIGIENIEKRSQIQKITYQASELIEKMSTIIWAMNTQNDTLDSFVQYLRRYAFGYLEDTHGIKLTFPLPDLPPSVLEANLLGETRREVFLVLKEALHNIVKHAKTDHVEMAISLKDKVLEIKIRDNGCGFTNKNPLGNGFKNMEKRMAAIGGKFTFLSSDTEGGVVHLSLPLNNS